MSDMFVASNGGTVEVLGNGRTTVTDVSPDPRLGNSATSHTTYLDPNQIDSLREFFQHERDAELGRWRWPERPEYIVFPSALYLTPSDPDHVHVVNESNGQSHRAHRDEDATLFGNFSVAARAYFAAHPEQKPWHGAKPGEVWVVTDENGEHPYTVDETQFYDIHRDCAIDFTDKGISAARRIWPESTDG